MPLVEQILSGKDEAMKAAALAFVQEIPGPDGTAAMRALLPKLPVAARAAIITQLGRRGDPAAKPAILEALKDHDEPIQAAALGALGSLGGAADLIAIAKSDPKPVNQVLALQGYLGLVDVPDRPAAEKVKMCQEALAVARRPDEKKRVLGILGGVKSVEALRLVLPLTDDAPVKKEAEQAAIQIADALGGRVPADLKDAVGKIRAAAKETQPKRPPRRR